MQPAAAANPAQNRDRNKCHFTIEASAVAYGSGTVSFSVNDFMWGRLDPPGRRQVTVPATTIRKLLEKYKFDVVNLISDCEGTEVDFVRNEREILRDRVKWLILETHEAERGKDAVAKMLADLASLGFETREQDAKKAVYAFENKNLRKSIN